MIVQATYKKNVLFSSQKWKRPVLYLPHVKQPRKVIILTKHSRQEIPQTACCKARACNCSQRNWLHL